MKGNSTCPMCRRNICFRGFTHSVNKWQQEKEEQKLQQVFADAIDHVLIDDPESEWSDEESEWSDEEPEEPRQLEEPEEPRQLEERGDSPEPRWEEDSDSGWSEDDSEFDINILMTEIGPYINPPNKIDLIIEMEKKFNNFKDEYESDDLLEIVVHPYYTVQKTKDHFLYEKKPTTTSLLSKYTSHKLTGISQKRRRHMQTLGPSFSLIQFLLGQLVLIV